MSNRPEITPEMKVGEFLDHYPELEEKLIAMAPGFAKLKNPVLRNTVAQVANLNQAARVGGITVAQIIADLREAAGLAPIEVKEPPAEGSGAVSEMADWAQNIDEILERDVRPDIEAGNHPVGEVVASSLELKGNQALEITTPFKPVPLLKKLEERNFKLWSREVGPDMWKTLIAPGD